MPTTNKCVITKNLSEYYDTESSILQYMNHSCNSNVEITKNGSDLIARRNIKAGEMITFNYNTTEYEIFRPFECLCKEDCCMGEIRGFKHLDQSEQYYLLNNYNCSPLIQNVGKKLKTKRLIDQNEPLYLLVLSPNYTNYEFKNIDLHTKIHKYDHKAITNKDIDHIIDNFYNSEYDFVINLCDGYQDDPIEPGLNILEKLESNLIPFSGSSSSVYTISKADIEKSGYSPKFQTYDDYLLNGLKIDYPLFIKPNNLGGSKFIDDASLVSNITELESKLSDITNFTKDILIQQYIAGDEYTCLVFRDKNLDIICLDPIKIKFLSETKYKTDLIKNTNYDQIVIDINIDDVLMGNIKKAVLTTYKKLNLDSYIRMDIRVDHNKNIYIVDINPYSGIFGTTIEECMGDLIIKKYYEFLIDIITSSLL